LPFTFGEEAAVHFFIVAVVSDVFCSLRQRIFYWGSGASTAAVGIARVHLSSFPLLELIPYQKRHTQRDNAQRNYLLPIAHSFTPIIKRPLGKR
jgi:hypothetical protein